MLTVMAVIAILAGLIVSVNAYAHKKAALVRAEGEIRTMVASCESYKGDFGDFPRDLSGSSSATDELDPRVDGDPTKEKYQKASLTLYKALSGDDNANGRATGKQYFEFRPDQLHKSRRATLSSSRTHLETRTVTRLPTPRMSRYSVSN